MVSDLLGFKSVKEVDWAAINIEDCWLPYDWETGDLFALPALRGEMERRHGMTGNNLKVLRILQEYL